MAIITHPTRVYRPCDEVFDDLIFRPRIEGGTLVFWKLKSTVKLVTPYTFTLQFGHAPTAPDDEWINVGTTTAYSLQDTVQRRFGQSNYVYYRIKLTEGDGDFVTYSRAAAPFGNWSYKEVCLYQAVGRSERIRLMSRTGTEGILYKRRVYGTPCPACLDHSTGVPTDSNCPVCLATGFVGGYYPPEGCVWGEITQQTMREAIDMQGLRGTVNDQTIQGRFFADKEFNTYDIWIARTTSERYFVQQVQNVEELRGIPVIYQIELRLVPPTNIIYKLPLTLEKFNDCTFDNVCSPVNNTIINATVNNTQEQNLDIYKDFL